jgi:hypothetical protein
LASKPIQAAAKLAVIFKMGRRVPIAIVGLLGSARPKQCCQSTFIAKSRRLCIPSASIGLNKIKWVRRAQIPRVINTIKVKISSNYERDTKNKKDG